MENEEEPVVEVQEVKMQKKNIILVLVLVILLSFLTVPFLIYRYVINASTIAKNETFIINEGEGVSTIARDLAAEGLINSQVAFKIHLKLKKIDTNIQAGSYVIPADSSIVDLGKIFQHGRNDITLTYIEGWRVEQLATLLSEELDNIDYTEFVKEARGYEGYLFPDTYVFNKDVTQEKVLEILKDTFDKKTQTFLNEKNLSDIGLTKNEAATFASIVEREALHDEDRKIIAGILIKRYKEGMKIEADATTQYAVALLKHCTPAECLVEDVACDLDPSVAVCETGLYTNYLVDIDWWPHDLTNYLLNFDSPYNTRAEALLPPAPISSFSISSLDAVINYEPTQYYFYLSDSKGKTHYATTLAEHEANVNAYLR